MPPFMSIINSINSSHFVVKLDCSIICITSVQTYMSIQRKDDPEFPKGLDKEHMPNIIVGSPIEHSISIRQPIQICKPMKEENFGVLC